MIADRESSGLLCGVSIAPGIIIELVICAGAADNERGTIAEAGVRCIGCRGGQVDADRRIFVEEEGVGPIE